VVAAAASADRGRRLFSLASSSRPGEVADNR
jgi:hypothetical protein